MSSGCGIRTSDLRKNWSLKRRLRTVLRDAVVSTLGVFSRLAEESSGIRILYYHHIFDDECENFSRQISFLQGLGEFISLTEAYQILESKQPINKLYFVLTFDDGYQNNLSNAAPILTHHQVSACLFLASGYIGLPSSDPKCQKFFAEHSFSVTTPFLRWEEVQEWVNLGFEVGAHTRWHERLSSLDEQQCRATLQASKQDIEEQLGIRCAHFAAPWGRPNKDFLTERDPQIAKELGFSSFLTTRRGVNHAATSPFETSRDHVSAEWNLSQLKYFLSR